MSSTRRVRNIVNQLTPSIYQDPSFSIVSQTTASNEQKTKKQDNDVVIVAAVRTPICRAKRGGLKDTYAEDLLTPVLKSLLSRSKISPALIGDIVIGSVLGQNNQRANELRIASFLAGIPDTVPINMVNRQCSSGLQAIANVAASIRAGYYDVGIGGGVETMSLVNPGWDGTINPKIFLNPQAKACLLPMGITSENVAKKYNVSRKQQDEFSVQSHARAANAIKTGRFRDEIVPVIVKQKDEKTGMEKEVPISIDDGVREGTTLEGLSKLPPAFTKDGTTTAGNASQVSDGAAGVLLMSRKKANELNLPIMGIFRSYAVTGVPPEIMGIGPATAIPAALKKAGLSTSDVDLFEINEAFASQAVYCCNVLGLDTEKVNVNGGAIALGHPLGCTGARQTASLLAEMAKRGSRYGVVSMCIGSGMGAAAVYERE